MSNRKNYVGGKFKGSYTERGN